MLYREAGQFKTNYAADMAIMPILQDRVGLGVILFVAAVLIPWLGSSFLIQAVMIPFLIFSLATIGLNLLTGYTGLLSLGTGAFMGVGAYACYKLTTYFPGVNILIWVLASGFFSAIVGGLIIGIGEKLGDFYWGALLGRGIESWLAYFIALVFLLFRPQGLFGEKIIERV